MRSILRQLLPGHGDPVFRKVLVVLAGSAGSRAISFVTMCLLVRSFAPEQYGLLSTVDTINGFCAGIIATGLNWWMVRTVSLDGISRHAKGIRTSLLGQLGWSLACGIALVLGSRFVANSILRKPETEPFVILSAVGVLGYVLVAYRSALYQALKLFRRDSMFNVLNSAAFLASLAVLVFFVKATSVIPVALAYVAVPIAVSSVALVLSPGRRVGQEPVSMPVESRGTTGSDSRRGIQWLLIYSLALWLSAQVHMIVLTRCRPLSEVGSYALALKIYLMSLMVTNAVNVVLLPQFSSSVHSGRLALEMRRMLRATGILAAFIVAMIPVATWLLVPLAGQEYGPATGPLRVFLLGTALSAVFSPPVNALFALGKFRVLALGGLAMVSGSTALHLILIPRYGAMAAALVQVGSFFAMNFFYSWVASRLTRSGPTPSEGKPEER
jgi:O-antigen/teichoic acid export membrane protein